MASTVAVLDAGAGAAVGVGLGAGPAVVVAGTAARARHTVALLVMYPSMDPFRIGRHGGSPYSFMRAKAPHLVARRAHAHRPAAPGGSGVSREEREREVVPTTVRQGDGRGFSREEREWRELPTAVRQGDGGSSSEEEGDDDDEGLGSSHGGGWTWCSAKCRW